jgi:glycosyltransferase involved in cell wall biosynthesis
MVGFLDALKRIDSQNQYYVFVSPRNREQFSSCRNAGNFTFVNCHYSNENRYCRVLAEQLLLPYQAAKVKLDVVHSHSNVLPFFGGTPSVVNIKTTHHFHTPQSIPFARSLYRHVMHRMSVNKASRIIVSSTATKEDVVRFYGVSPEKVDVVFEGGGESFTTCSDITSLRSRLLAKYGINGRYVLFVSTLWDYKNADGTIRGFARVAAAHPDLLLVIAGNDYEGAKARLQELASKLGIGHRVLFLGHVPNQELPLLYQGALVFVYPSFYETFGLTVVEAFKCGCPVITSNVGSLPEVSGGASILIEPSSVDAIADAVAALARDEAFRNERIQRGLQRGAEFSWDRTARETLAVFERVALSEPAAGAA